MGVNASLPHQSRRSTGLCQAHLDDSVGDAQEEGAELAQPRSGFQRIDASISCTLSQGDVTLGRDMIALLPDWKDLRSEAI